MNNHQYNKIGIGIAKTHNLKYAGVQRYKAKTLLLFTGTEQAGIPPTTFATNETGSNVLAKIAEVKKNFKIGGKYDTKFTSSASQVDACGDKR